MSFVRFLFTIVIAGVVVNLAIVLLANNWSHNNQERQYYRQKQQAIEKFAQAGEGRVRRLDMVVESQHVGSLDGRDKVIDSTLLVRQYQSIANDQSKPLPVERIVITGDKVEVEGLKLTFDSMFSQEDEEFQWLRDKTLLYFSRVCGAGEKAPEEPLPDERFTFTPRDRVPQLTRIDPTDERPFYFETRLWQRLWEIIPDPQKGEVSAPAKANMQVTWLKPAQRVLRRNHTYTALITTNDITLDEDRAGIPNLLNAMLEAGRKPSEESGPK